MKMRHSAAVPSLIMALMVGLLPGPARATSSDESKPVRLRASAHFGPIGTITLAGSDLKNVFVNGRPASNNDALWGGELIKAPTFGSVGIQFESRGRVTLRDGALARFSTAHPSAGAEEMLVASLLAGSMLVRLAPTSGAYVEALGVRYNASPGANFHVAITDGQPSVETFEGTVSEQQQPAAQRRYILRPIPRDPSFSVSARSTRQLQIQVTDENDKPVPDLPIIFSLGDPCLGTLGLGAAAATTFKEKSDKAGLVTVLFTAGAAKCSSSITATAEGTRSTHTWNVSVSAASQSFWTTRNTLLVAAGLAGAGVGIGLAVANSGGSEPLRPVPPPGVKP
jgi:hypothetical protein